MTLKDKAAYQHEKALAAALKNSYSTAEKILDFFQLKLDGDHQLSFAIDDRVMDGQQFKNIADAAACVVSWYKTLYVPCQKCLSVSKVSNPFFMKSLEEINIMLDMMGDDARAS